MRQLLVPVALLPVLGAAAPAGSWVDDPSLRRDAMRRQPATAPLFRLDLDLPPEDRWTAIYRHPLFQAAPTDVQNYFGSVLPKWAVPLVESIAGDIEGRFKDYGREMKGVAKALNVSVGMVTLINLVYALEEVAGSDCTLQNTTGPCKKDRNSPGMCTGIIAEAPDGTMWHGRNMDWNLPSMLRKYVIDVEFARAGEPLFRGTTVAGLVGCMHGMLLKPGGFSGSINARDEGGSALMNILTLIGGKYLTASHLLRLTLESQTSFDAGVSLVTKTALVQPVYFVLAGTGKQQGAIVSRDREPPAKDVWLMNQTAATAPWFLLQTNYDHWQAPPAWDDRRTPGIAHMRALGQAGVGEKGLLKVMHQWPTFNDHTDVTAVMSAAHGAYWSAVWLDGSLAGGDEQVTVVV